MHRNTVQDIAGIQNLDHDYIKIKHLQKRKNVLVFYFTCNHL